MKSRLRQMVDEEDLAVDIRTFAAMYDPEEEGAGGARTTSVAK